MPMAAQVRRLYVPLPELRETVMQPDQPRVLQVAAVREAVAEQLSSTRRQPNDRRRDSKLEASYCNTLSHVQLQYQGETGAGKQQIETR